MPAKALYIHVPFCERKCNYCAFVSSVPKSGERTLYLEALSAELYMMAEKCRDPFDTCYIGGGTPTMLSPSQWRTLAAAIEKNFTFAAGAEVTVEANPNSMSREHLEVWRNWRVTRVSIGVQSFNDAELSRMGRVHCADEARRALSAALSFGFDVNADLIFGLPGQTFRSWGKTLREAAASGLSHISLYQLTPEEGTPWGALTAEELGDGYAPYRWAQWYLPHKGYAQYEIANFARPGHESRHNINYWHSGEYIGTGPAAAGYISDRRYKNTDSLAEYAKCLKSGRLPESESETLPPEKRAREAAVLALRMSSGICADDFVKKYGAENYRSISAAVESFPQDLYETDCRGIRLTKKGMRVANLIWAEII